MKREENPCQNMSIFKNKACTYIGTAARFRTTWMPFCYKSCTRKVLYPAISINSFSRFLRSWNKFHVGIQALPCSAYLSFCILTSKFHSSSTATPIYNVMDFVLIQTASCKNLQNSKFSPYAKLLFSTTSAPSPFLLRCPHRSTSPPFNLYKKVLPA
jgi:hypothetical protein